MFESCIFCIFLCFKLFFCCLQRCRVGILIFFCVVVCCILFVVLFIVFVRSACGVLVGIIFVFAFFFSSVNLLPNFKIVFLCCRCVCLYLKFVHCV